MTAGQSRKIWLTRHGESCFNMAGRIGGDSGLTARGEEYARLLPDVLESRLPAVSVTFFTHNRRQQHHWVVTCCLMCMCWMLHVRLLI
jgi:broad specificity phosphatase PhoE